MRELQLRQPGSIVLQMGSGKKVSYVGHLEQALQHPFFCVHDRSVKEGKKLERSIE